MNRALLTLMALASLAMASYAKTALTADSAPLNWNDWQITVCSVQLEHEAAGKVAPSDSVYVVLDVLVKNLGNEGRAFIPQNSVKLMVNGRQYDGMDIEDTFLGDMENIQPGIARHRLCYFEVPTVVQVAPNTISVKFVQLFVDDKQIAVQQTEVNPEPSPTVRPMTTDTREQVTAREQASVATATPPPAPTPPQPAPYDFVLNVYKHFQNHDWQWLTRFTVDGRTNYFGHHRASNAFIAQDMRNDTARYGQWNVTYFKDTYWRELSNEYSHYWMGAMAYDHIDMISNVYEYGVRWHSARIRFTVGYAMGAGDGDLHIYAIIYQVL